MKAIRIKVKVKCHFEIQILKAGLEINVNKERVKLIAHFFNLRLIIKCSVFDLIAATSKIFPIALKTLTLLRFLNQS